ncbi:MAG: hypothetical protein ACRYG4_28265 [Janthinobacterium lividum]
MDNFDALMIAFGPGSLDRAKRKLRQGEHLGLEMVAAVKEANADWRDDAEFAAFETRTNGGQKRRRGRPRDTDLKPRERIAEAFYLPVLEYIQRKRKSGTLTKWLKLVERRLGYIDETLPNHLIAGEAIKSYFGLELTATRFLRRMTERQTGHRYKPISQV